MNAKQLLLGLLFLVLGSAFLFGQELTGTLKGTVTDSDAAALPGASVTIQSPNLLGGPKTAATDEQGKYRFINLDPGFYGVTVTMDGFSTDTRKEQRIQVGTVTTIDFSLKVAEVAELIEVTGQTPVVDVEASGVQHNVTQELILDIPIARQYQSIIAMLPGVKGGANPNVHGESNQNNQYLVDGVDTTDPTTGTFGTNFVFEAIQDIQYSTAGYMPEYGQVMGAVTNIVTRSGGNEIHGGVNFMTYQPSFRWDHSNEAKNEETNESEVYELSGFFGGPIQQDKVWYFGTMEFYDRKTTNDLVDYDDAVRVYYWLGKLSSQLNPDNRLVFQGHGDPYDRDGENLSSDWAKDANPHRKQGGFGLSGDWTWVLSPSAFLQTRTYYNKQVLDISGVNGDVAGVYDMDAYLRSPDTKEAFNLENWGQQGSVFATNKSLNRRYRKQFESDYSHLLEKGGDHEIKAGIEVEFSNEQTTTGGAWTQLSQYFIDQGFLNGWQQPGAVWDGTRNYSQYRHSEGIEEDSRRRVSLYVQDKWSYKRATVSYGLRVDDTVAENDVKQDILNFTTFSPRVGVSYDVVGNGKTVIRGSGGRYYENPRLTFPGAFNQNATPYNRYMYSWTTHEFDILRSIFGGPSGYVIYQDESLKSPYKDEFTVGAEHEILPDFSVGIDYIRSRTKDILEDIEINALWEQYVDTKFGLSVPNWLITDYVNGEPQIIFALTNPKEARRRYDGVELTFNKRFSDHWQLFGSYTWSKAKGTVEDAFTAFADSPGEFYNRDGFLAHDRTHDIVINASYHLPYGIRFGTRITLQSGAPFTLSYRDGEDNMNVWLAPRGSATPVAFTVTDRNGGTWKTYAVGDTMRTPWSKQVDIRTEKAFKFGGNEFGVYMDMYNLFNFSGLTGFDSNEDSLGGSPTFQGPRQMQLMSRFTF